ncbi:hypothetical protein [Enterovibrio norvegicus]|uniref:hypothetical protein n=1 Tax=Enterovibrio norvegicus TaxID=188144 RepID=UPI00352BDDB8
MYNQDLTDHETSLAENLDATFRQTFDCTYRLPDLDDILRLKSEIELSGDAYLRLEGECPKERLQREIKQLTKNKSTVQVVREIHQRADSYARHRRVVPPKMPSLREHFSNLFYAWRHRNVFFDVTRQNPVGIMKHEYWCCQWKQRDYENG